VRRYAVPQSGDIQNIGFQITHCVCFHCLHLDGLPHSEPVYAGVLEVRFRRNGAIWQYADVPEGTYTAMKISASPGKVFHALVKSHVPQYPALKIR
jgi:hypothetical protein